MNPKTLSTTLWLALRPKSRWDLAARMTKGKPALAKDEVAVQLTVELPSSLFEKPSLAAKIVGTGEAPRLDLTPELVADIQQHLEAQTGLRIELVQKVEAAPEDFPSRLQRYLAGNVDEVAGDE